MFGKLSAAGLVGVVCLAGPAAAQTAVPSGPPPSWESLIPCAQKADPAEGFKCYQVALRAAGYVPNPQVVAEDRRRRFGLPLPSIGHKGPPKTEPKLAQAQAQPGPGPTAAAPRAPAAAPEESEDRVTVTLEQVALIPPLNRLLLVTTDGGIWQQTDSETVAPLPRPGQTMTVLKGSISGFFCQFDKRTKVRCTRTH
jgi:hypothetical protein